MKGLGFGNYFCCNLEFFSFISSIVPLYRLVAEFLVILMEYIPLKYFESFEMWCLRITEHISWTDRVTDVQVLQSFKEDRNILQTIKRRKPNRIGHILSRKCLLKHVIEGNIEGNRRRGSRRKQRLKDLKEQEGAGK
jgi:hypothetical protein